MNGLEIHPLFCAERTDDKELHFLATWQLGFGKVLWLDQLPCGFHSYRFQFSHVLGLVHHRKIVKFILGQIKPKVLVKPFFLEQNVIAKIRQARPTANMAAFKRCKFSVRIVMLSKFSNR